MIEEILEGIVAFWDMITSIFKRDDDD